MFHFRKRQCFGYSFLINGASAILGLPIVIFVQASNPDLFYLFIPWVPLIELFGWIGFYLVLTIFIEIILLYVLFRLKDKTRKKANDPEKLQVPSKQRFWPPGMVNERDQIPLLKIIGFCLVANLASYSITLFLPFLCCTTLIFR